MLDAGKKKFLYSHCATVLLCSLVTSSAIPAQASTQGTAGANSTGSINISVIKSAVSRISGLTDMAVVWSGSGDDIFWTNDLCIYSSRANGSYKVTGLGASGAGGAFILRDGTRQIPYTVSWNAGGSGNLTNEGTTLSPGVALTSLTNASTTSPSCGGSASNARLIVNIAKQDLQAVPAGHYAESLTLIIAPD